MNKFVAESCNIAEKGQVHLKGVRRLLQKPQSEIMPATGKTGFTREGKSFREKAPGTVLPVQQVPERLVPCGPIGCGRGLK